MNTNTLTLKEKYWDGRLNYGIRIYFYATRGVDIFNQFRNVIFVVFGAYWTFKLHNPWWLIGMMVIGVMLLICMGWFAVHKMGKVVDYLNIHYSTHWSRYNYELLEGIQNELRELNGRPRQEGGNKHG